MLRTNAGDTTFQVRVLEVVRGNVTGRTFTLEVSSGADMHLCAAVPHGPGRYLLAAHFVDGVATIGRCTYGASLLDDARA